MANSKSNAPLVTREPLFIGDLAKEASMSVETFQRTMVDLERKGWLRVERVSGDLMRITPTIPEGASHE